MPTFIGFNTINQNKKFTLVDFDLIKIDLLNAFNIRQGELPGRPAYGTIITAAPGKKLLTRNVCKNAAAAGAEERHEKE